MKTKTFSKLIFIFLLAFQNIFSQAILKSNSNLFTGHIYSAESGLPIANATIKTLSRAGLRYFTTDKKGKFEIPNDYKKTIDFTEITSLGFKKEVRKGVLETIYLENDNNELDEVIVSTKLKMKNELSFLEKLNTRETNFSWNDKASIYIPKNSDDKCIKNLLFAVSDFGGVKNLQYLPFSVNLYTADSLGMPDKPIFEQDIPAKKEKPEHWTKIDISKYKIKIPEAGIFVVFIILPENAYPIDFIKAKFGNNIRTIAAVPALKAYNYSKTYIRKSYLYYECDDIENCNKWKPQILHYMMDVEY